MCMSANSFLLSCSKLKAVSLLFSTILSANCSIVSLLNLTKNSLPFMLRYIGKSATIKAPAKILFSSLWVLNLKSLCSLNAIQLRCIAGFSTNAVASIPCSSSSKVNSMIGSSTHIKQS